MKTYRFVLLLLLAISFAGCSSSPGIVGKWKVDPDYSKEVDSKLTPGFMVGFASTFTYEFMADKTFKGLMTAGTYTMDGNKLAMTTKTINGQDLAKLGAPTDKPQMTGDLSADGKTLTLHPQTGGLLPDALKDVRMTRNTS